MQTNSLTKKNISKLKSVYTKILMNFLQMITLLNFFNEHEDAAKEKTINKAFEIVSGYFINIVYFDCILQGLLF